MNIKFFVRSSQVGDMAKWSKEKGLLIDEVLKIGQSIMFQPSIRLDSIKEITQSEIKQKKLNLREKTIYEISGKICGGYFMHTIFLVIDCGIPIRIAINDPREFEEEIITGFTGEIIGRKLTVVEKPEKDLIKFMFKNGEFLLFESEIEAMWLDTWEGRIRTYLKGVIVEREKQKNDGLIITVECQPPFRPLVEYDSSYSGNAQKIDEDHDSFTVEY